MIKLQKFLFTLLFLNAVFTAAAAPVAPPPVINAEAAVLLDAETGRILYEKNQDQPIPPASMTKLMTIHTAMKFINAGEASLNDYVPVSAEADFRNQPPRSSLMFIEEGQKVTLGELLTGLALPSGNDAGIAVAEYLAGSVEDFVSLMNEEAARLGMKLTHFDDSSGLSEFNRTTAREYAMFCRHYINENAALLQDMHKLTEFTYPEPENYGSSGRSVHGPITQPNHNILIERMAGVDGLKTGYIDESGYNFAVTAVQGDRRLILVTMGGPGSNSYDGSLRRAFDAVSLLTYGFYAWTAFIPAVPVGEKLEIKAGSRDSIRVAYSEAAGQLIQTARIDDLVFIPEYSSIEFPVQTGDIVGRWSLVLDGETLQEGVITAAEDVKRGNIFKRLKAILAD